MARVFLVRFVTRGRSKNRIQKTSGSYSSRTRKVPSYAETHYTGPRAQCTNIRIARVRSKTIRVSIISPIVRFNCRPNRRTRITIVRRLLYRSHNSAYIYICIYVYVYIDDANVTLSIHLYYSANVSRRCTMSVIT